MLGYPSVFALNLSRGGVPKAATSLARLGPLGFEGDGQHDKKHHGGPERAVSLWSLEIIESLAAAGHPIFPGATGENVTIRGLPWSALTPGVMVALGGEAVVQVTSYCTPCRTIARCFSDGDFRRISHLTHPERSRLYAGVLSGGWVTRGDQVRLLSRTKW